MITTLIAILILSYGFIVLTTGFAGIRVWDANKALPACAILLLIFLANTQVQNNFILLKMIISAWIVSIYNFFISSNHLVISLDIIVLLSILLLILHHTFKMAKPLRQDNQAS